MEENPPIPGMVTSIGMEDLAEEPEVLQDYLVPTVAPTVRTELAAELLVKVKEPLLERLANLVILSTPEAAEEGPEHKVE